MLCYNKLLSGGMNRKGGLIMITYKNIIEQEYQTVVASYKKSVIAEASYQSEAQMETRFIKDLQAQGYEYDRGITTHATLFVNLKQKIENLNSKIRKEDIKFTDAEWVRFFDLELKYGGLIEKTKTIQQDFIKNFTFDNPRLKHINNITLIDKENPLNNHLQVINQYETVGNYKNRYDVTILVNGLPIVHIELKRRGVHIKEAFNQIERYERDSFWADGGLFEYIQIFIISNGTNTKYFSNTTREAKLTGNSKKSLEFTMWWAARNNETIKDLDDFVQTFFARHTLLYILTKYCILNTEEQLMIMRPYQIAATEKILEKINISHLNKWAGTNNSGGYIWHTTGSGKTLTSFKTAQLATDLPYIEKVLFVVDRKVLDYQTMKEYDKFEKGAANATMSSRELENSLKDPDKKIIITTIQKLERFINKS